MDVNKADAITPTVDTLGRHAPGQQRNPGADADASEDQPEEGWSDDDAVDVHGLPTGALTPEAQRLIDSLAAQIEPMRRELEQAQAHEWASTAEARGLKVVIAAAGMAAALPGVVAAVTQLPVLGVPMETRVMGGMDSLLSMAQMPGGIPVGTLAVGKAGAKNAALLAAAILALSDDAIHARLKAFRQAQNEAVAELPAD